MPSPVKNKLSLSRMCSTTNRTSTVYEMTGQTSQACAPEPPAKACLVLEGTKMLCTPAREERLDLVGRAQAGRRRGGGGDRGGDCSLAGREMATRQKMGKPDDDNAGTALGQGLKWERGRWKGAVWRCA